MSVLYGLVEMSLQSKFSLNDWSIGALSPESRGEVPHCSQLLSALVACAEPQDPTSGSHCTSLIM